MISCTVLYCFLFRFVCIEFVSLIWFLQIWVAIYVYGNGTMINWFTLIKKLMQTYIVIVSGSILNVSTVHLNGVWDLTWRYLSKPVLGGHPVLSGHYNIPRGCPLNTRFTVVKHYHLSKLFTLINSSILPIFFKSLSLNIILDKGELSSAKKETWGFSYIAHVHWDKNWI